MFLECNVISSLRFSQVHAHVYVLCLYVEFSMSSFSFPRLGYNFLFAITILFLHFSNSQNKRLAFCLTSVLSPMFPAFTSSKTPAMLAVTESINNKVGSKNKISPGSWLTGILKGFRFQKKTESS